MENTSISISGDYCCILTSWFDACFVLSGMLAVLWMKFIALFSFVSSSVIKLFALAHGALYMMKRKYSDDNHNLLLYYNTTMHWPTMGKKCFWFPDLSNSTIVNVSNLYDIYTLKILSCVGQHNGQSGYCDLLWSTRRLNQDKDSGCGFYGGKMSHTRIMQWLFKLVGFVLFWLVKQVNEQRFWSCIALHYMVVYF